MKLIELKCANCSGAIKVTQGQNFAVCAFCDTQYYVQQDQNGMPVDLAPVVAKLDRVAEAVDGVAESIRRVEMHSSESVIASSRIANEIALARLTGELTPITVELRTAREQLSTIGFDPDSDYRNGDWAIWFGIVFASAMFGLCGAAVGDLTGFLIAFVISVLFGYVSYRNDPDSLSIKPKYRKSYKQALPILKKMEQLSAQEAELHAEIEVAKRKLL